MAVRQQFLELYVLIIGNCTVGLGTPEFSSELIVSCGKLGPATYFQVLNSLTGARLEALRCGAGQCPTLEEIEDAVRSVKAITFRLEVQRLRPGPVNCRVQIARRRPFPMQARNLEQFRVNQASRLRPHAGQRRGAVFQFIEEAAKGHLRGPGRGGEDRGRLLRHRLEVRKRSVPPTENRLPQRGDLPNGPVVIDCAAAPQRLSGVQPRLRAVHDSFDHMHEILSAGTL